MISGSRSQRAALDTVTEFCSSVVELCPYSPPASFYPEPGGPGRGAADHGRAAVTAVEPAPHRGRLPAGHDG